MAGLQRSQVSFRRQGSSGVVWDDKFLSGELNKIHDHKKLNNNNKAHDITNDAVLNTSSRRGFSTADRGTPVTEPPSPRVSACGLCGAFGNNNKKTRRMTKSGKRVM